MVAASLKHFPQLMGTACQENLHCPPGWGSPKQWLTDKGVWKAVSFAPRWGEITLKFCFGSNALSIPHCGSGRLDFTWETGLPTPSPTCPASLPLLPVFPGSHSFNKPWSSESLTEALIWSSPSFGPWTSGEGILFIISWTKIRTLMNGATRWQNF